MQLYTVSNRKPMPAERHVVIVSDGFIGIEGECGRQ